MATMNYLKQIFKIVPQPKMPLGRWCHPQYIESCCSKVQYRKAELANIDNSLDVRSHGTKIKTNNYDSSEDSLLTIMYNKDK